MSTQSEYQEFSKHWGKFQRWNSYVFWAVAGCPHRHRRGAKNDLGLWAFEVALWSMNHPIAVSPVLLRSVGNKRNWNCFPHIGTQLMCGDSNPARTQFRTQTHIVRTWNQPNPTVFQLRSHTWFQGLMKLRCFMSYYRKNPVRDKELGKKWICLERCTPRRRVGDISEGESCLEIWCG